MGCDVIEPGSIDVSVTSQSTSILKTLVAYIRRQEVTQLDDVEKLSVERFETPPLLRKAVKKPKVKNLRVVVHTKKVSWNEKTISRESPAVSIETSDDVTSTDSYVTTQSHFYDDIDMSEENENECSEFAYKCVVLCTVVAVLLLIIFYFLILAFNPQLMTSSGESLTDVTTQAINVYDKDWSTLSYSI